MTELNEKDYREKVINSQLPTLLYFSAVWSNDCKIASTTIEKLSKNKDFNIFKIDISTEQSLSTLLGIDCIPTCIIIKNGEIIEKFSGLANIEKITLETRCII